MISNKQYIFILLLSASQSFTAAVSIGNRAGCGITINGDLSDPQPLLLIPGGGDTYETAFFLPDGGSSDVVSFDENEIMTLACPGGTLLQSGSDSGQMSVDVTCVSGKNFLYNGNSVSFSSFTCSRYPFHTARYTGNTCLSQYKEVEVGFDIETRFIRNMMICFDDVGQNTIYSTFFLTKTIGGYQSGFPRPNFIEEDFYNVGNNRVEDLYTRDTQRATINGLLGLSSGDTQYIHASDDYFMSRGHLTAKADYVYGSQHRLTFYYINVAPQWQTFNGGNWNTLEMSTRSFASSRALDLTVYTGGFGVSTLPDVNGIDQELYLYVDGSAKGLPVPKIYWKVVYDPIARAGVAFIGVNNPYSGSEQDLAFCTNVCSQINWVNWDPTDNVLGYGSCCDVNDFRTTVTTLPDFPVDSLLV